MISKQANTHTIQCMGQDISLKSIRSMFRVLGIYNFGEPVEFDRFFSLEFRPGGTFSNQKE